MKYMTKTDDDVSGIENFNCDLLHILAYFTDIAKVGIWIMRLIVGN